jgi:hypothetical protein
VDSGLVEEPPSPALVAQLTEKVRSLEERLAQDVDGHCYGQKVVSFEDKIGRLEEKIASLEAAAKLSASQEAELTARNAFLEKQLEEYKYTIDRSARSHPGAYVAVI